MGRTPSEIGARAEFAVAAALSAAGKAVYVPLFGARPSWPPRPGRLFGVYSPELDQVFLVPVDEVPERGCSLRIERARNGQVKRVRWARDYAISAPRSTGDRPPSSA